MEQTRYNSYMKKLQRYKMKILKYAIGSLAAFIIAEIFHLQYAISTPVITLLTIQNTKKETMTVTINRILSFVVAVILSTVTFQLFSYSPLSFGIFILLFSASCVGANLMDGFISSTVLITHIYMNKAIDAQILMNEVAIMIIGISIGVLLNLFMQNEEKEINENQKFIESRLYELLLDLSSLLNNEESSFSVHRDEMKVLLNETRSKSIENRDNRLIANTTYYIEYVNMRMQQVDILNQIYHSVRHIEAQTQYVEPITNFMIHIGESLDEYNSAEGLLEELEELKIFYEQSELPGSRKEFEERAVLYGVIMQLESFLIIKLQFSTSHQNLVESL